MLLKLRGDVAIPLKFVGATCAKGVSAKHLETIGRLVEEDVTGSAWLNYEGSLSLQ